MAKVKAKDRGGDFVDFQLKAAAPEAVAVGGRRFAARFRRSEAPFRATRGEWTVFLEPLGFFELAVEARKAKAPENKTEN